MQMDQYHMLELRTNAGLCTLSEKNEFVEIGEMLIQMGHPIDDYLTNFAFADSERKIWLFKEMREELEILKNHANLKSFVATIDSHDDYITNDKIYDTIKSFTENLPPFDEDFNRWNIRQKFAKKFSWDIPSKDAIRKIVEFVGQNSKILSVGSGKGLWEALIAEENVPVTCTDIGSPGEYYKQEELQKTWAVPELISSADAMVKYYDHDVLFMCWSSFNVDADHLKNFNGSKIIFIGELGRGCTYDGNSLLKFGFDLAETVKIPQWEGVNDLMIFYTRQ